MSAETRTTSSTGGEKGAKIERYDLIPSGPLRALATHFGRGASKYADHNWRRGYPWSLSISALMRHFEEWREGRDFDVCSNDVPEACSFVTKDGEPFEPTLPDTCYNHTGSHHLDAVMWQAFVLRDFVDNHPEHDDRYVEPEKPGPLEQIADELMRQEGRMWQIPDTVFTPIEQWPVIESQAFIEWRDPEPMTFRLRETAWETLQLAFGMPTREAVRVGEGVVERTTLADLRREALAQRDVRRWLDDFDIARYLDVFQDHIRDLVAICGWPTYYVVEPDGTIEPSTMREYLNDALNRR